MTEWTVGQRVEVLDRGYGRAHTIATITRVTPPGQVTVGPKGEEVRFSANGREIGREWRFARSISAMTPEREAQVAMIQRGYVALSKLRKAADNIGKWQRKAFPDVGRQVPEIEDVELAEALTDAINAAMSGAE